MVARPLRDSFGEPTSISVEWFFLSPCRRVQEHPQTGLRSRPHPALLGQIWRRNRQPDGFARYWLYCYLVQFTSQPQGWSPDEVDEPMKSLFERLRSRRLASAFVLLATLSLAIVAGSFAAHGVRGQESKNDSADATPLKVFNSPVAPNEFVRIAKQVRPAVVNINTRTLPKQSANKGRRNPNPHTRIQPAPQNPGDDDQGDEPQQGQGQGQGARAAPPESRKPAQSTAP